MAFHESYGDLPAVLLAAIKAYNVSPADFDLLGYEFGQGNHDAILAAIHARSDRGYYIPANMGAGTW